MTNISMAQDFFQFVWSYDGTIVHVYPTKYIPLHECSAGEEAKVSIPHILESNPMVNSKLIHGKSWSKRWWFNRVFYLIATLDYFWHSVNNHKEINMISNLSVIHFTIWLTHTEEQHGIFRYWMSFLYGYTHNMYFYLMVWSIIGPFILPL